MLKNTVFSFFPIFVSFVLLLPFLFTWQLFFCIKLGSSVFFLHYQITMKFHPNYCKRAYISSGQFEAHYQNDNLSSAMTYPIQLFSPLEKRLDFMFNFVVFFRICRNIFNMGPARVCWCVFRVKSARDSYTWQKRTSEKPNVTVVRDTSETRTTELFYFNVQTPRKER